MAQLGWSAAQTRQQFRAVMWLRWRIFRNGFRRKSSKGDLLALLLVAPLFFLVVLSMAAGAGGAAWYLTGANHLQRLSWVLWAIFVLSQLANINLGQPGTTFDPTQLIRFPLHLRAYVAVRLFFGMLSPANMIVGIISLAVAIGVTAARPGLAGYALLAMAVFALVNILFTRMVFAWVDRWLSTRRAREVFTAVIFIGSMGLQVANFMFNPAYHAHETSKMRARVAAGRRVYAQTEPYLNAFPPALAGNALDRAAHLQPLGYAGDMALCALYGVAFLGVFAVRTRTEYLGESLSDAANGVATPPLATRARPGPPAFDTAPAGPGLRSDAPAAPGWRTTVLAMVGKEFLYLRRNMGLFYGLVAPLVMVAIFAGRMASRSHGDWVFPAALGYAMLGVVPVSYNALGQDGTGAQFYFMAPVRIRDILLAKNLLNVLLAAFEVVAILILVCMVAVAPSPLMLVSAVLWTGATLLLAITVGNYRSINTPKRLDPGKTAQKQASPLSALMSMGILLLVGAFGWGILLLAAHLHMAWITPLVMLLLLVAAAGIYWANLGRMDEYALKHREALFEELGKKA